MTKIMTTKAIKETLRNGRFAWPGGYPLYFIAADGEPLSFEAVRENWREICSAHIHRGFLDKQWQLVGVEINWEDTALYCAHTNKRIESAYGEDD